MRGVGRGACVHFFRENKQAERQTDIQREGGSAGQVKTRYLHTHAEGSYRQGFLIAQTRRAHSYRDLHLAALGPDALRSPYRRRVFRQKSGTRARLRFDRQSRCWVPTADGAGSCCCSLSADGPNQRAGSPIPTTATLPSCPRSQRIFPFLSLFGSRLRYRLYIDYIYMYFLIAMSKFRTLYTDLVNKTSGKTCYI